MRRPENQPVTNRGGVAPQFTASEYVLFELLVHALIYQWLIYFYTVLTILIAFSPGFTRAN